MKKQWVMMALAGVAIAFFQPLNAADLMQVYQQALTSDPSFKAAYSTEMAEAEAVPSNLAFLLPQINLTSGALWSHSRTASDNYAAAANHSGTPLHVRLKSRTTNVNLDLTQTIFDFTNWMNLASAQASVKAAKATYNAAAQDLMQRTAQAYFNVLQARDMLRFSISEKQALYQEYLQANERLRVGVATITDVDNARAAYDGAIADYIAANNDVANKVEDLRSITGKSYSALATLRTTIPLIMPKPTSIDQWVSTGVKQNWSYIAAHYTALAAHRNIWAQRGGHMPTVSASAGYDNQLKRTYGGRGRTRTTGPSAELDFSLPIFSGGAVSSSVRKAIADFETATHQEDEIYRQVVNQTRKAYLGVNSGISTVKAQKQVVISNKSSLDGTKAGYQVGTRTMVDVLLAQRALYQSQRDYAAARYNYLMSIIGLKQSAGILSEEDLQKINSWLHSSSVKQKLVRKSQVKKNIVQKKPTPRKPKKQHKLGKGVVETRFIRPVS